MRSALVLLGLLGALPVGASPRLYALVIGNNQPVDGSTAELHYADDDALSFHQLLLEANASSVLLTRLDAQTRALNPDVHPEAPTLEGVERAWRDIELALRQAASAGTPAEFLLFFSGHGEVSEGEGFLALEGGRLTRSRLTAMLNAAPSRRNHVVVDACKASLAVLGKGPGGRREPYHRGLVGNASAPTGYLLSASSDTDAHEWERYQAGVFTFELRSALRGSADVDGDGRITYEELGGFLSRANEGIVNARFKPDFLVRAPGAGVGGLREAVLDWRRPAALTLEGPSEHVYVETATGARVLELNAGPQSFALHLPAQRPLFIRSADERVERTLLAAEPTRLTDLSVSTPQVSSKGALHLAFQRLFAVPFDAQSVQAFSSGYQAPSLDVSVAWVDDWRAVKTGSLVTAGVGAATAVTASLYALERSAFTTMTPQTERFERNRGIATANVLLGVGVAVAVAGAVSWLIVTLVNREEAPAMSAFVRTILDVNALSQP
ncbi:MAG: caspase family protein [Myxococcaceae bacterium]